MTDCVLLQPNKLDFFPSDSVPDPIKYHINFTGSAFSGVIIHKPLPVFLSVTSEVKGFCYPVYVRDVRMSAPFLKLINRNFNYDSISLAMTFFIVAHRTWIGPLFWGF